MASEKILNQKKEEVKKLAEQMKEAKLILLVDYRGINVTDVTAVSYTHLDVYKRQESDYGS